MVKIYTKTGDAGLTGLYGGERVPKDSPRIETCGAIDELNSWLSFSRDLLPEAGWADSIAGIQKDLFTLGADVATPEKSKTSARAPRIGPHHVKAIETLIDAAETALPPQDRFYLPGGCPASNAVEIARGVCRRAERRLWTLAHNEPVNREAAVYLNRLADYLYVLARLINKRQGVREIPWEPPPPAG